MTDLRNALSSAMPGVFADLERLVAIPSCAFPGFPREPVLQMADATVELLQRSGAANARRIEVPGGFPVIYADIAGPVGSPTVLLYAHYDVQPAPPEQGWTVDPWTPVVRDGRLYGRGAADDKSGIAMHAATLQAFGGHPPVHLKIVIEGEEETNSHLATFAESNPELFAADVFVIADSGNDVVGHPILCTAMRGYAACTVEVRTLKQAVHSGLFGGVAPDALVALIQMLATMHDATGNTVIPGLSRGEWKGSELSEDLVRRMAGVCDGVDLVGSGSVNTRLVMRPSATVIGIDAPPVAGAVNALVPVARATVSLRVPPGTDAQSELDVMVQHLRSVAPWNIEVSITDQSIGEAFSTPSGGAALEEAKLAMAATYGRPANESGSGGSIPLLNTLQQLNPKAEFIVWGAEDGERANIHSADESVSLVELEQAALAQVLFLERLGPPPP
jgi:acetylornithine deacetylase/succinyl-diaminopimelate desuccinylase-like protein